MPIVECTLPEGGKGYKWGGSGKCYPTRAQAEKQAAAAHANGFMGDQLGMDKKTVRTVNKFGHMQVEMSNISKAAVNPYYGREIPNGVALGLEPDRIYYLLRDPEELRKAAHTFNNLPILSKHIPVTAEKPSQELIVGTTGTDAVFDEPYLRNSLAVWTADAIAGIETDQQRQLSSAYSYEADMTPGSYAGVKYDGIMRNIVGNHVALVEEGRAGPDVIVGDSKLLEIPKMKLTAKQVMLLGALSAYSATVIAQDAQIGDLHAVVAVGKSLKTPKEQKAVVTAATKMLTPHLAEDMGLEGLAPLVAAIADSDDPTPEMPGAMDDDPMAALTELLAKLGVAPEVAAKIQSMCSGGAMDEDPEPEPKKEDTVDKTAMDAAIKAATDATRAQLLAVRNAEIDVQPVIGVLAIAQDSAPAVYKLALDHMKVDLTGVDESSYQAVFKAVRGQAATQTTVTPPSRIALDAAIGGAKTFADMFPNASKIGG